MKKIIASLLFVAASFVSYGQCSTVVVQISSSDTTYIQLYHAGFFNIPSGFANIVEWEVTSFSGDLIHQETTSGNFEDQSFILFDHSIPITDSMKATILITNDMEGITCAMSDTLYWQETEVLPGSFIGNWAILSSNGGMEEDITAASERISTIQNIELFPSPAFDYFEIKSDLAIASFAIFNLNGQVLGTYENVQTQEKIDISKYSVGVYFVRFWDKNGRDFGIKKLIKL